MASIVVSGDTSGAITISAPAVAGTPTLTLPTDTGTLVVTGGAQTVQFATGSAAAPSITFSGRTNTGLFSPAANTVGFSTSGTEQMRIDSSGNVGIGVTPSAWGSTYKAQQIGQAGVLAGHSSVPAFTLASNAYENSGWKAITTNPAQRIDLSSDNNATIFYRAASVTAGSALSWSESMRIDSSGNLLVGTTTTAGGNAPHLKAATGINTKEGTGGNYGSNVYNFNWTGYVFQAWVDSTNLGTVAFTSDYRIKRNIKTQTQPALERVMQLRPVTYQVADYGDLFKASDDIKEGFIAHEVQEVIPSGADGEKDAENQIQSLRVDAILAVAVKAIQELNAKVEAQAAEIKALKGAK